MCSAVVGGLSSLLWNVSWGAFDLSIKPDWITFTSSSTVRNFVSMAGAGAIAGAKVASIGPIASATARELGIEVSVEASVFTVDGLVEALLRALS